MKLLDLCFALAVSTMAAGAWAASNPAPSCPAPMVFTQQKSALLAELQETRNEETGLFLTRRLVALYGIAPNWRAQEMLDAAISARQRQDFAAAETQLDALIAYCPSFAESYHQRALLRRAQGDLPGALADLDTTLDHAPDHLGAMARKAQVLAAMGRIKDGAALRDEVRMLNPWLPARFTQFGPGGSDA